MKKWLKRLIIIVVVVGVLTGAYFIYDGVTAKAEVDEAFSSAPSTGQVTTGDITLSVSGSGNLASPASVQFEAAGYMIIDEVLVEEGDTIEAGQTVATLDLEEMNEYLSELEESIVSIQTDIDTMNGVAGDKPTKDAPWFFNVCRQRIGGGRELSAFSPTNSGSFHVKIKFGKLYTE